MRKKNLFKALIALTLVAAMLCGSAMAATLSAKVFAPSMSLYKTKSTRTRIAVARQGASIKVSKISGKWAKVTYKGKTGYAELKNIVFNKHIKAVSTKSTRIRFITKKSYKRNTYYTGTLAKGVPLYVAGISGNYYLFYNKSGSTLGYISKSAVRRASSSNAGSSYVYIAPATGEKYHRKSCPSLKGKSVKKVTLKWAVAHGYKKCKIKNG